MPGYTRRTFLITPLGDDSIDPEGATRTAVRAMLTAQLGRDCSQEIGAVWSPVAAPWPPTHAVTSAQMTQAEVDACLPFVVPESALYVAGVRVFAEVVEGLDDQPGASVPYTAQVDLDALGAQVAIVDVGSPLPPDPLHPALRWTLAMVRALLATDGAVYPAGVTDADPFWTPPE